jgi:hypothetical protein
MIYPKEILGDNTLPEKYRVNYEALLHKCNILRKEYGKPMIVTSGFRSLEDHKRIYKLKGISNPPMGSAHLRCQAIDFADSDKLLKNWVLNNVQFMIDIGFWIEDPQWTPTWLHLQIVPPKSHKRFFIP